MVAAATPCPRSVAVAGADVRGRPSQGLARNGRYESVTDSRRPARNPSASARRGRLYRLIAWDDAQHLTGLTPQFLLELSDTQYLERIDREGRRERFVRVPEELLGGGEAPGDAEDARTPEPA